MGGARVSLPVRSPHADGSASSGWCASCWSCHRCSRACRLELAPAPWWSWWWAPATNRTKWPNCWGACLPSVPRRPAGGHDPLDALPLEELAAPLSAFAEQFLQRLGEGVVLTQVASPGLQALEQALGALFCAGWTLDDLLALGAEQLRVVSTCVVEYRALQLGTVMEVVAGALGGTVDKPTAKRPKRALKASEGIAGTDAAADSLRLGLPVATVGGRRIGAYAVDGAARAHAHALEAPARSASCSSSWTTTPTSARAWRRPEGRQAATAGQRQDGAGAGAHRGARVDEQRPLPAAAFGAAVKVGAEFEQAITQVGAIAGATEQGFTSLEGKARQRATTMFQRRGRHPPWDLARAGHRCEILDASGPLCWLAVRARAWGRLPRSTAATLAPFGLQASDAGRVSDVFQHGPARSVPCGQQPGTASSARHRWRWL